jgi:hypothetical protein
MPTLGDIKQMLRAEMPYLRKRYGVDRLGICGSFVRGEQTDTSDVDLLVTFSETPTLYEFVNLKRYLETCWSETSIWGCPRPSEKAPPPTTFAARSNISDAKPTPVRSGYSPGHGGGRALRGRCAIRGPRRRS